MKLPLLLDVYESKECEGILAPYIVKDSILKMVESMISSQEKLRCVLDSIPSMNISHGNVQHTAPLNGCITTQVTNNLIHDNGYEGGVMEGDNCLVLPPHKVTYDKNGNRRYESDIYHPCLQPYNPPKKEVFKTGEYPNDVDTYSSLKELENFQKNGDSVMCVPCSNHLNNIVHVTECKDELIESLCNSWMENIQRIQITNLISTLVSTNKISLNLSLIKSLEIVLKTTLREFSKYVCKIGVMEVGVRTLSSPHTKITQMAFVQLNTSNENIVNQIDSRFKELLSGQPESVIVATITSEKKFQEMQCSYQIPVCFECQEGKYASNDIPTFEMIFVDKNQFARRVNIELKYPENCVDFFGSPVSSINVSTGTSGKLSFVLGNKSGNERYSLKNVIINEHHCYPVDELLDGVEMYEIGRLSLSMESVADGFYKIAHLNYTNIKSDVEIRINPILELTLNDFDVDPNNSDCAVTTLSSMALVNRVVDYDEMLSVCVKLKFTKPIYQLLISNINVYKVMRLANEEVVKLPFTECNVHTVSQSAQCITKEKNVVLSFVHHIREVGEFVIHFNPNALYTTFVQDGLTREAINGEEIVVHFTFNPETKMIEFYDEEEIPPYFVVIPDPEPSPEPGDEDQTEDDKIEGPENNPSTNTPDGSEDNEDSNVEQA